MIVKILRNNDASKLEKYLINKLAMEGPTTEHSCDLDGMTKEFKGVQNDFNSKGNNAIHLIQSLSPKESKILTKDQVHELGIKLAERFAPGHQYVVQTHTKEEHAHNHIVINPVHMETGKRIQNKLEYIPIVRGFNDQIAKEHGLEVLPPQEKIRNQGPKEISKRIDTYRGKSYILDLASKAEFARTHATNYDQYVAVLNSFDIQVRIEPQNITYFYPGKNHGKRGKNLSPKLDKEGLENTFSRNRERAQQLGIDSKPASALVSKRAEEITKPRPSELEQSLIPIEELNRAKTGNILRYCEKSKIKLTQDEKGATVLKGRPYVEVSDHTWINHRNKTRGNIIDFVSSHHQVGYLKAVSIINDNPNLLLLESLSKSPSARYQSFYVPKEEAAPRAEAIAQLSKLIGHQHSNPVYGELFRRQCVHVNKSGAIRFFAEKEPSGYLEFTPVQGSYKTKKEGSLSTPLIQKKSQNGRLIISTDPVETLKRRPEMIAGSRNTREGLVILMEPSVDAAKKAIATQRNIKNVKIMSDSREPGILQFFNELKSALNPFSIETELVWHRDLPRSKPEPPNHEIGLTRDL